MLGLDRNLSKYATRLVFSKYYNLNYRHSYFMAWLFKYWILEFCKNSRKVNYDTFIWHWLMGFINKPLTCSRKVVKAYTKWSKFPTMYETPTICFDGLTVLHAWNTILYSYEAHFQKMPLLETINDGFGTYGNFLYSLSYVLLYR